MDRFVFTRDLMDCANGFSDTAERLEFYEMLFAYALDGVEPEDGSRFRGMFRAVRPGIDKANRRKAVRIAPKDANDAGPVVVMANVDDVPRTLLPTNREMAMYASHLGVSGVELSRFLEEMEERGWTYLSHGNAVQVNRRNFKTCLSSFTRTQRRIDGERNAAVYQQEGYDGSELD